MWVFGMGYHHQGLVPCVNAAGRRPKNLYILPGGIAEVYTSTPGKHCIVFKNRRGLVKLCLETGAAIIPTYVFGGTDFFHNLATSDSWLSKLSRRLRMSLTIFWGPFFLPIPYFPKVSMVMAEPITVEKWTGDGPVPSNLIDELHDRYLATLVKLFDDYKAIAGYPDAVLEIE
jgi:diacylglycerol O-acyltransferase 2, plant